MTFYGGCMVKAVSNSGPIIHLSGVNCFGALQIADVVIPSAVYHEVPAMINSGQRNCKTYIYQLSGLTKKKKSLPSDYVVRMGLMPGKLKQLRFVFPESISYSSPMTPMQGTLANSCVIEVHGTAGIAARAHSCNYSGT